jgi:hypothetical protein
MYPVPMETPSETDTIHVLQHYRTEAAGYRKRWAKSLGIGCGGAAIALVSLAANLPDPNYAFRLFAPSLWLFLIGVIFSTASLLSTAQHLESAGTHYDAAFNRDQYHSSARKLPEVSPDKNDQKPRFGGVKSRGGRRARNGYCVSTFVRANFGGPRNLRLSSGSSWRTPQ